MQGTGKSLKHPVRQSSRQRADKGLISRQNAWATAYGLKTVSGKLTETPCYTVFVREKLPVSKLPKSERIPSYVSRKGVKYPTDVVEIKSLVLHAATSLSDGSNQATLSCFAASRRDIFGVSCAHGIWGPDSSILTPDEIRFWSPQRMEWLHVGKAQSIAFELGTGVAPDFGFMDAGLFSLEDPSVRSAATSLPLMRVLDGPGIGFALLGLQVFAEGGVSGRCEGIVHQVFFSAGADNRRLDVVVRSIDGRGMTRKGDSGMVWRTANGEALCLHILGEERGPGVPSVFSFCTFINRLKKRFQVELLG